MFNEEEEEEENQTYFPVKPPSSLSPNHFYSFAPRTIFNQQNQNENNTHELLSDDDSDSLKSNLSFDDIPPPVIRNSIETQTKQNESIFEIQDFNKTKEEEEEEEEILSNENQMDDYESNLIQIKMVLSDLNDKIASIKNECTIQNQTKLNADISYLRQMMKSIHANVDTQNMQINDMKKTLENYVIPHQDNNFLSKIRDFKNKEEQYINYQIEIMCTILNKCVDEKFKEEASSILANKTNELEKLMDEKETLLNELSMLEDQFLKQDQFINDQKYKQDKKLLKARLVKQYYKDMKNIQLSALEDEKKNSIINQQTNHNHFISPPNRFSQTNHNIKQNLSSPILPPLASYKQQTNQVKQFSPVKPIMRPLKNLGPNLSLIEGNRSARTHSFFRLKETKQNELISKIQQNDDSDSN